ncbi:MAG: hypothetical protein DI598_13330, partial [Pseudopedobacter saltans]
LETATTPYKSDIANRLPKGNQEMMVWEATTVCAGNKMSFKDAVKLGESMIIGEKAFQYALDIQAARTMNIQPLSFIDNPEELSSDFHLKKVKTKEEFVNIGEQKTFDLQSLNAQTKNDKQRVWERKLLDLTLRNSLLNLRLSNNTIQLVNVDFQNLLQLLLEDKKISIGNTLPLGIYAERRYLIDTLNEVDGIYNYAKSEIKFGRLITAYNYNDMSTVLTQIMRNNVLSIDETGANSLYLTMGVLKWYDTNTPNTVRIAPLIMVPVDLKRLSILSSFHIKYRDEDIQINATLIEMLQQEFELNLSGLHQLMDTEETIDIQQILNTVRQAILPHKNWEVDELIFLSNFNFSTQVLWQDIHDNMNVLQQHPIIQGFVEQKFQTDRSLELPENIDTHNVATDEHIFPIDADSSQMESVIAANMGKSFVLHGPPGSGKSQTITNIIANFLFHGKTVLFVAAKRAALDVVQKRLDSIGLSKFTLEIHSNKSKKSDVLQHLESSIQQIKLNPDNVFAETATKIAIERKEIDAIQHAVHLKQNVGLSIYSLIEELTKYSVPKEGAFSFPNEILDTLSAEDLANWQKWIDTLAHEPIFNTDYQKNPLFSVEQIQYFIGIESFVQQIDLKNFSLVENSLEKIAQFLPHYYTRIIQIQDLNTLIQSLQKINTAPIKLLGSEFLYQYDDHQTVLGFYQEANKLEQDILNSFENGVLNLDAERLKLEYQQANQQWFLPKFFKVRKVKKEVALYAKSKLDESGLSTFLEKGSQLKSLRQLLSVAVNQQMVNNLGKLAQNPQAKDLLTQHKSDIEQIQTLLNKLDLKHFFQTRVESTPFQATIQELFDYNQWQILNEFVSNWQNILPTIEKFTHTFTFKKPAETFEEQTEQLQLLQQNVSNIQTWSNFRNHIQKGQELGLKTFLQYVEEKHIAPTELTTNFTYNLYSSLLQFYLLRDDTLKTFSGLHMEQMLAHYKLLQKNFTEFTKKEIYLRLLQRLPSTQFATIDNSELSILQKAIRSKGRGVSIRSLIQRTQNIFPRIVPCMLMSPISVAQYLDINLPKFDLVIFDEASQLPTSEAISAMARGKQVIIVGDPKQMPPTSFFSTQKVDEEQLELEDLESILDDTLSINVPSKYLLRHYRSQHESLITFSNKSFYDNELFTFPSADDNISRVQLVKVDGYYDKGKTRQNPAEASAVVNEVLKRLQSPSLRKKTIGIVTFSQTQQSLIEDLLDKAFVKYPEMEAVAQQMSEPIFVKNLENVQGDERDVILFSVGYGPDENGAVSMNFGPLNKEGGWRRLNVAITRAKYEMMVFSTLQSDMIDLSRTQSKGVEALKGFLAFASKNNLANNTIEVHSNKDLLLSEIGTFLQSNDYEFSYHVGQSYFKIDIAIAHPKFPEQYILGLILDNENYLQAGNINDRSIIIPNVLQQLGWHLQQIWALDWQYKKAEVQQKILQLLDELVNSSEMPEQATEVLHQVYTFNSSAMQEMAINSEVVSSKARVYEFAEIPVERVGGADVFMASENLDIVKEQLLQIVTTEAPISRTMLQKSLLQIWNISRSGARIERFVTDLIQQSDFSTTHFQEETFIWTKETHPDNLDFYRTMPEQEKRSAQDLSPEEIFICLKEALQHLIQLDKENASKYIQKTLMNARYNATWNDYIWSAITEGNKHFLIEETEQGYKING